MAAQTPKPCDLLISTLRGFLQALPTPSRLLVAVSGGSDSKGLLIALHELLQDSSHLAVTLAAATIDHGLRPESAQEAREVKGLCTKLGIAHVTSRWDEPKPKTGISSAARNARYRLLSEAATSLKADIIVTGHTADDQAETIAMRQSRNADDAALGLSGMADHMLYRNRIWIYRPLLTCHRQMIRDFLTARGMGWVDDPSNSNPHYERARVRLELTESVRPALPSQHDRLTLSTQAASLIERYARVPASGVVELDAAVFDSPQPVLRHASQAMLATLGGQSHGPADQSLARLLALLAQANGSRITLGRCLVHRSRAGLFLVREARGLKTITLAAGEAAVWDGRWHIHNPSLGALQVSPTGTTGKEALEDTSAVPASLAALGRHSMPQLQYPHLQISAEVQCHRLISPYCTFLPGFDWPLAHALALLFGAKPFFLPYF
ncbi:tRNA lysidine(34) synthetase TilS [Rhizobium sp.]|uniref:tRNA lysidine(34) synthetase TilS n=1 Tax=Rhizobium sp. TaxID=391 RepID=UPI002AA5F9B0